MNYGWNPIIDGPLSDGATYQGTSTPTLEISFPGCAEKGNYRVKVVLAQACATLYSNTANFQPVLGRDPMGTPVECCL